MSAQAVPALPANIPSITAVAKATFTRADQQALLDQMVLDMIALRNALDTLTTNFNNHTHKTPTTNPGTTSTPTSDAGGSGSTGGTALSNAAPANIVTSMT